MNTRTHLSGGRGRILRRLAGLLGIGALALAPLCATAAYPEKPVRLIVGFAAGGPTDIVARAIAKHLGDTMKGTFIVDNKPGAAGNLGAAEVARAPADGYTLLVTGANLTINTGLDLDQKYDSEKSFSPIGIVAVAPTVLVVRPNFEAQNYAAFIDSGRKQPGKFTVATAGGTGMTAEYFMQLTGIKLVPVPYKGAAPAMSDLMAGHVDLSFATLGSVLPQIQAKQVRALAIATPRREASLPDVPTFAELGLEQFKLDSWFGVLAPAGAPAAVVKAISAQLEALARSPGFAQQMATAGMNTRTATPEDMAKLISAEVKHYKALGARIAPAR